MFLKLNHLCLILFGLFWCFLGVMVTDLVTIKDCGHKKALSDTTSDRAHDFLN